MQMYPNWSSAQTRTHHEKKRKKKQEKFDGGILFSLEQNKNNNKNRLKITNTKVPFFHFEIPIDDGLVF